MILEMKILLAMAPICSIAMVYALTQGDWCGAVNLAFIAFVAFIVYRAQKRSQAVSASDETTP